MNVIGEGIPTVLVISDFQPLFEWLLWGVVAIALVQRAWRIFTSV